MKKTVKLIISVILIITLFTSAFALAACNRGGARNPEQAAINIIRAVSRQNPRHLADALGLTGDERNTFITEWEENDQNIEPDRNENPQAHTAFRHRRDEFRSISFVSFTGPANIAASVLTTSGTARFTFMFINNRGERVERERTVSLTFNREEGGNWYSARGNISSIESAMTRS